MWMYHLAEQHAIHPGAKDPQFNPTYRNFLTDGANVLPSSLSHIQALLAESKTSESADRAQEKQTKVKTVYSVMSMSLLWLLCPNQICLDDFDLVKVIGKGSFGKVTLVKKKSDGRLFAMKV
jgi:hypothetical protein